MKKIVCKLKIKKRRKKTVSVFPLVVCIFPKSTTTLMIGQWQQILFLIGPDILQVTDGDGEWPAGRP